MYLLLSEGAMGGYRFVCACDNNSVGTSFFAY